MNTLMLFGTATAATMTGAAALPFVMHRLEGSLSRSSSPASPSAEAPAVAEAAPALEDGPGLQPDAA